ncbi:MAG: peptide chain release factor aRF-1 [Nitrososphaerales archaeon]
MGKYDSVKLYRLKRMLEELSQKLGRGTELVSLYIPQRKAIHEVVATLKEEYGTASNIKSDTTRNHVLDALTRTMQRLKLYNQTPENGLVIFCGALPTNGLGSEVITIYEVVPPKPLQTFLYRCDDHFHTDMLKMMLKEDKIIGILAIDSTESGLGLLLGDRLEIVEQISSGVAGKHRAGGQSAKRYERLREMELNYYFTRVAEHAKTIFLESHNVQGLLVAGPGPTKDEFLKQEYLDYRLQNGIMAVLDISYAGREGVREALEKAQDILQEYRLVEEKMLIKKLLAEVHSERGLATYGLNDVLQAVQNGVAELVLVGDNINMVRLEVVCKRCNNREEHIVERAKLIQLKQEKLSGTCPSCSAQDLDSKVQDLIDRLEELALKTGAKIEVISSKTEDGKMLESLGGVAAILRYRMR